MGHFVGRARLRIGFSGPLEVGKWSQRGWKGALEGGRGGGFIDFLPRGVPSNAYVWCPPHSVIVACVAERKQNSP